MTRQPDAVRGFLVSVGVEPEIRVQFQYNPQELQDRRTVSYATVNAPGAYAPIRQYTAGGERTISFTVTVDGLLADGAPGPGIDRDAERGIAPELVKYRAFVHPRTSRWQDAADRPDGFTGLYGDAERVFVAPPTCLFGFGERVIDCIVTEVTVTEQLFTRSLAPLRATVQISLTELTPYAADPSTGEVA